MKSAYVWLVTLLSVSFVLQALGPSEQVTAIAASAAVLAVAATLSGRYLAVVIVALTLRVGARSRAHREVLSEQVAPSHPNIDGRPRTRAPAARSEAFA